MTYNTIDVSYRKKYVDKNGYILVLAKCHPNRWKSSGLMFLHRIVMENHLRRYLSEGEIVHHKDGDKKNNDIDNLQILSLADHSILHHTQNGTNRKVRNCINCCVEFIPVSNDQKFCSLKCAHFSRRKIVWPSRDELEKMVWEKPTSSIAKELGVSDVAISKVCRKLGIKKPPRGFWT